MQFIKKFLLFIPLLIVIIFQGVTVGNFGKGSGILLYIVILGSISIIYLVQYENYISFKYKNFILTYRLAFLTPFLIIARIFIEFFDKIGTSGFEVAKVAMIVFGGIGAIFGFSVALIFYLLKIWMKRKYYTSK